MAGIMGGLVDDVKGMFAAAGGGARRTPGLQKVTNPEGPGNQDGVR